MRRWIPVLSCLVIVSMAFPALALNPGDDVLVPAAARAGSWITDLYVMNPGDATINGDVFWLERNMANPNPTGVAFAIEPGETMVMNDVILSEFGMESGAGAFHVVADGDLVVNSRIYSQDGTMTLGQGFEGVPAAAATMAGETTSVVGLGINDTFRTNFYALAGADGATMQVTLMDPDAAELASAELILEAYEPYLRGLNDLISAGDFDEGSLSVSVSAGSAVVGASKVDNASGDPTTLESSTPLGSGASVSGTYQIAIYDSEGFATGGNIVISDGQVVAMNSTYTNWDKDEDNNGEFDCTMLFLMGAGLPVTDLANFADGVEFTDSFAATGSGDFAWTLFLTATDGMSILGSIDAVGSNFPSSTDPFEDQSGCNGEFPTLTILGGKIN